MKNLITICLLIIANFTVYAQEQKTYYDNGKVKSIANYSNGKMNGEYKRYYENEQLERIGNVLNGKDNGEWKYYYANGQLKAIENRSGGNIIGEYKSYFDNGQLEKIGYIDNMASGVWKIYAKNGQLKEIGNLTNSKKNGEWKFYHDNGQLESIINYTDGKLTGELKSYHDNGQLKEIGYYTDWVKTGEWKSYHDNRQLKEIGYYTNGEKTGEWKKYLEDGQLKIGNYPEIQKYLDKLKKLELGDGDEPIKITQVFKGNTYTAIREQGGDVDKDYIENIPWDKYFYVHFYERKGGYSECIFFLKDFLNITSTSKYLGDKKESVKHNNETKEFSIMIFTKDTEEVKKIIDEFIKNNSK